MMKEVDLPEERREEVLNALDVDELAVREVLTPPADEIVSLSTAASVEEEISGSATPRTVASRSWATR